MNYVAILHSQLHLNAFIAYYSKYIQKNPAHFGLIYIKQDQNGKYLIDNSDLQSIDNCRIERLPFQKESLPKKLRRYIRDFVYTNRLIRIQKDGEPLLYLVPGMFRCRAKSLFEWQKQFEAGCVKMVHLEEGLGIYVNDDKDWMEPQCADKPKFIRKLIISIGLFFKEITDNRLIKKLEGNGNFEEFYLLRRSENKLVPNQEVCEAFAGVFAERSKHLGIQKDYKDVILINSQPLKELMGVDLDIKCYARIRDICEKRNIKLIVKPHPREKYVSRYRELGIEVDDSEKGISQEILLAGAKHKPLMMIGLHSTSLVTANLFYGIPTISIGKLDKFNSLPIYGESTQKFMNTFTNFLEIPENYKQLEDVIDRIVGSGAGKENLA